MNLDESMEALIISEISRNCNNNDVNEYMSTKDKLKSDKLCTSVCIYAYGYICMYVYKLMNKGIKEYIDTWIYR